MEPSAAKHSFAKNFLVRVLIFGVLIIVIRFAYVVTLAGETCNSGEFCFFTLPKKFNVVIAGNTPVKNDAVASTSSSGRDFYTSKEWIKSVQFYSSVFVELVTEGYLSPSSKSVCFETVRGEDVYALKEIGVNDAVGVSRKKSKPIRIPSEDESIDFAFCGGGKLDSAKRPGELAAEMMRMVKPEGFVVVHVRANDSYSFNSLLDLFNCCLLIRSREINGYDSSVSFIREFVLQKKSGIAETANKCSVHGHNRELVKNAEPLIMEEPLKPWLTLKKNMQNIKYFPSMVDISFKNRYVYVDVGARSYGSSIGSWFRKQYPKQNHTFDVYAIEADKHFHDEYKMKKAITLLPYAAWVRNETLSFEINSDPVKDVKDKGRGMGRIQPVRGGGSFDGVVDVIQGFDFAEWLKRTVSEKDFVVMKMDVEGTEFDLIPRLVETGAICLIDELFLECHYNRWQRCCPGQRSSKYERTYGQCLELFTSLRDRGVLVHQWW